MTEIAIIGAGPAGLMAAWRAAMKGHQVTIYERGSSTGGMSGSFEVAGQMVDYGSHRLHPATPTYLLEEIKELLGDDLQVRERNGRIRLYDRWVAFPLRSTNMVRHLPLKFSFNSALDVLSQPFTKKRDESFDDEVTHRLGKTVSSEFYSPYAKKLWGIPANEIDSELARRRVSATSPLAIFQKLLKSSTPTGRTFLYPRNGYGQIVASLTEAAVSAGASIQLNQEVKNIFLNDGRCSIEHSSGVSEAEFTWSTAPLTLLPKMISPAPSQQIFEAAESLRIRAMVLVYLVLDQPQFTTYDAHYLPGLETKMTRLSEPKNYRDGPDPRDTTVLCAEIPCWPQDEIWSMTDDQLGEMVLDDIERLGLPKPRHVQTEVCRLPSVYPIFEKSTNEKRAELLSWGNSLEGLSTFGRQGLAVPDNLHHTLIMGWEAAASLDDDGRLNQTNWRESLKGFESHVVED